MYMRDSNDVIKAIMFRVIIPAWVIILGVYLCSVLLFSKDTAEHEYEIDTIKIEHHNGLFDDGDYIVLTANNKTYETKFSKISVTISDKNTVIVVGDDIKSLQIDKDMQTKLGIISPK